MDYKVLNVNEQTYYVNGVGTPKLTICVAYQDAELGKSTSSVIQLPVESTDAQINQAIIDEGLKVKEMFLGSQPRNINMEGTIV